MREAYATHQRRKRLPLLFLLILGLLASLFSDSAVQSFGIPAPSTHRAQAMPNENSAPVLNPAAEFKMNDLMEDPVSDSGDSVAEIIASVGGDPITDPDVGAKEGIALTSADPSNGIWEISTDGGATWKVLGPVSVSSATVLDLDARIRFDPNPDTAVQSNFTFRAWDQTDNLPSGTTGINVTVNGGTTPYSADFATGLVQVTAVNDLPVVDLNGMEAGADFSALFFKSYGWVSVARFDATVVDVDSQISKVTLTLKGPDGDSELLEVDPTALEGTPINVIPFNSSTGKLVLENAASAADYQKVLRAITYQNDDPSPNPNLRTVEVQANDGTQNGAIAKTFIQMNLVNSPPVLLSDPSLALQPIEEDTLLLAGEQIKGLMDVGTITDPDSGAQEGIALIAAGNVNGSWQYSATNPPTGSGSWLPVGVVSSTSALLLYDTSWLRFVPNPNYHGQADALVFRAWDRTFGSNGQPTVDTTQPGVNAAFSIATNSITEMITPTNDAPVVGGVPPTLGSYVEDGPSLPVPGAALTLVDYDSGDMVTSAKVRLTNPEDGTAELLTVEAGGTTGISAEYAAGLLQLSGAALPSVYQQVLRTVKYVNASQDPTAGMRVVEFSAADGVGSGSVVSTSFSVVPVNDPPGLDLDGVGPNLDFATTFFINRGPVDVVADSLVVFDLDDTTIQSATLKIVNLLNPGSEFLAVDTNGLVNIQSSYDPSTGVLSLTGAGSLTNYQTILRTATYDNTLLQPNTSTREVEFTMSDGLGTSEVRTTTISIVEASVVYHFLPVSVGYAFKHEEPNNTCLEATAMPLNRESAYHVDAVDKIDWFYFYLPAHSNVKVIIKNFSQGQVLVYAATVSGTCYDVTESTRIGFYGGQLSEATVDLGALQAGRYYIRTLYDADQPVTYSLQVEVSAP